MSNWEFLEKHRCTKPNQFVPLFYVSDSSFGFNGMFRFYLDGHLIRCVASDGGVEEGKRWQHVSVSIEGDKRPPKWDVMCAVKDLFWNDEDWVVQFHPAHSEYVNQHPGCLHLWRPLDETLPTPSSLMVGIKKK